MKKSVIFVFTLLFIVVILVIVRYNNFQSRKKSLISFNKQYEDYNKDSINGYDVVSIINNAISNNEKYEINKNDEGIYILDDEYSIEIYITMIINNTTYPMEKINKLGMNQFIMNFGNVEFKCTDIQYHKKTGRVKSMTFEPTEY